MLVSYLFASVLLTLNAPTALPMWAQAQWKQSGLSRTFNRASYAQPAILEADFNGDGKQDVAILIIRKTTRSKGILILHQSLPQYHLLGTGPEKSSAILKGSFSWVTHWSLYAQPTAKEVLFTKSGDVSGGRTVHLNHPAIEVISEEQGGGLIYWNSRCYTWLHQTD